MLLVGDWAPERMQVRTDLNSTIILSNLEGPVLPANHSINPTTKAGPNIYSTQIPTKENGRFIFSLANNHIMDYGLSGLNATLNVLKQEKIMACGAGKDIDSARQPLFFEDNGVKIGLIACCEAQFGVAKRNVPGVAEYGPWVYSAIKNLSEMVDAVIVSVHAAVENSPWPSPFIRELYRSFIDAGAAVVHGHHSHIPQGYESYREGIIFYGMGNFAVDPKKWHNNPNSLWSIGAEIDLKYGRPVRWRPLTFEIRNKLCSEITFIEESNRDEQLIHNHYLNICNRPFTNPDLFEALWHEVALLAYYNYGAKYMRFVSQPKQGWRAKIHRRLLILKNVLINKKVTQYVSNQYDYMVWHHMIACESHRQMLATALGILAGEIKDLRTEESRRLSKEMMPQKQSFKE